MTRSAILSLRAGVRIAVVALVCAMSPSPAAARAGVRVAVSYFANRTGDKKLDPLKRGLADMMITDLAASDDVTVVERDRLQALVSELKLQKNPYFDKRSAKKLGKGLGAAYLITGTYILAADRLSLEARVIDVETAKIVLGVRQRGKKSDLFALQTTLAKKLLAGLGAKLSLLGKKRIGQRGSKSFKAFGHYARSLAARDRGDKRAERVWLKKALAVDPNFLAVKDRLTKLESRVAHLERSGGLIITPKAAADHLHNARLHKQAGRTPKARKSVLDALTRHPRLVEAWLLLDTLAPKAPQSALRRLTLSTEERAIFYAFIMKNTRALARRVPSPRPFGGKQKTSDLDAALAAALLFKRCDSSLPLPSATAVARLYRSIRALRRPRFRKLLRRHLIDPAGFFARVDAVFRRSFAGPLNEWLDGYGMTAMILNRSSYHRPWPFWEIHIGLYDLVKGPVTISLHKQHAHPHWREKPVARGYLGFVHDRIHYRLPRTIHTALGDRRKLVFRAQWPIKAGRSQPPLRAVSFGSKMTFQPGSLRCQRHAGSLTGTRCQLLVYVSKGNLLPGCYRLEVSYTYKGQAVRLHYPVLWAHDVQLLARPPQGKHIRMTWLKKIVHRVNGSNRSSYAKLPELAGVSRFDLLINVEPIFAENHGYDTKGARLMHHRVPYPVKSIHYDLDGRLLGGRSQLPKETDFAGWQRYREKILRRGYKRPAAIYNDQFLPLPALKKGRHTICIVLRHINGAKSAEPDCRFFSVP